MHLGLCCLCFENTRLSLDNMVRRIVFATPNFGRPYFPKKPQNHNQTDPHFFSASTQANSTKFSMQPYYNPTKLNITKKITKEDTKKIQNEDDQKNSKWKMTKKIQNGRQQKNSK